MIVVSDNSPLQYLVLTGCVDVLPKLYQEILTSPQIVHELRHPRTPQAVRDWVDAMPPWMRVESPSTIDFLDTLDIGEASAIALARQRDADLLLMDERAGTRAARSAGIRTVGTLGVLIDAGLENLLDFDAAINRLVAQTPFHASASLIAAAHRIFNERRT